ncbi:hypothetical protein RQV73_001712 [Vibrio fluvialis]|nr:hypothetical protein [Vibrio fluvialis]
MNSVPIEQQLFYSKDGQSWFSSPDGIHLSDAKCAGFVYVHKTYTEYLALTGHDSKSQQRKDFVEHSWVKSELDLAQTELMYHWTNDTERKKASEDEWKQYMIALRNYTTVDADGIPRTTIDERPLKPI